MGAAPRDPAAQHARTLRSYLFLPRPGDLSKAIVLPIGAAVGWALGAHPTADRVLAGVLVWFAVEYLAYQARYQWNDIRGFHSDQLHPDHAQRGRLPGPIERGRRHIAVSAAVAVARVAGAGLLALVVRPAHLAGVLLGSVAAVFLVALAYEWVRSTAAGCPTDERPSTSCVALWAVSGGGYCVRGLTGLLITASGDLSTARIVAAGIACWFAGVLFVTTRWAVESMPFARRHGDRLAWAADEQAKRGHLLALARWLPRDAAAAPHDLRRWRPMWTTAPVGAPWNLAALPALAAAWVLGVGPAHAVGSLHVVGSLVLVVACWLTLIGGPRLVRTSIACAVAATVASLTAGTVRAAIPAIVVCVLYAVCTHQRLVDVGASWQRLGRAIATALHRADGRRPAARGATPSPGYSTSARP